VFFDFEKRMSGILKKINKIVKQRISRTIMSLLDRIRLSERELSKFILWNGKSGF